MKLRLLKAWQKYVAGDIVKVEDNEDANELIEKGIGEEYDIVKDGEAEAARVKAQAEHDEKVAAAAAELAIKSMNEMAKKNGNGLPFIQTHDNSDDDPLGGFGPEGHSYKQSDLEKNPWPIYSAIGKFCQAVGQAKTKGENEPLRKLAERSEKMRQKAAGDGMIVGDDEHGGYMIFSAASMMLQARAFEASVIRPLASKVTMGTQLLNLPYLKDENHTSTVYGGIQVYFDDELSQLTASRPELAMMEMKLKKMTVLGHASGEWLKWSPVTFGSWFMPKFGEAIGWKEDQVFINGKGGAQPLGILSSNGSVSITKETSQVADTILRANIDKMFARLRPRDENSVIWLCNRSCFPQFPLLNVTFGTGGAPVFTNNIGAKPGQSLWGYPIRYSEFAATVGDTKDISLVDVSDYLVADDQSGPEVAQSLHLKFDYDQMTFRIIKYIDGQNMQQVAFTPHKAGATAVQTLSTVVLLDARG